MAVERVSCFTNLGVKASEPPALKYIAHFMTTTTFVLIKPLIKFVRVAYNGEDPHEPGKASLNVRLVQTYDNRPHRRIVTICTT